MVTFGSPTVAVEAGGTMTDVVVWETNEVVSITGTPTDGAVLSAASVDSMFETMLDERLLVARLGTAEIGI